ncbi:MAG: metallophosphoesterase family protein [Desulfatibacillaceae bacterium]
MAHENLRRVGIIGDVHAEDVLLERAIRLLKDAGAELVVCTGDVVDGPGNVDRCVSLLALEDVLVVKGNHDQWFLANRLRSLPKATQPGNVDVTSASFINLLPLCRDVGTIAGGVVICHGLGENTMAKVTPDDYGYGLEVNDDLWELVRDPRYAYAVCGHSHRRMVRHFDGLCVINAGTLSRDEQPCCLLADFQTGEARFLLLDEAGAPVGEEVENLFP